MNKFLSIISLFLFSFGMFNVSYAECGTINLTCTQDLELKWTSTGQSPYSCVVGGAGWPGSNECNSQNVSGSNSGWVRIPSANISEGTSYYTFRGEPIVQPPTNMTDTCTIVKATGCNTSGSYSISANPNPVKICSPATTGSSNISWTAPAGQNVDVWVVGNPNKFANVIGSGSALANWIQVGVPATFEIKKYNSSTVEATVTVTGTSNGCSTGSGYCGDLIKQTPNSSGVNEQCDAGSQNGVLGSGCSDACTTVSGSVCGNDIREGDEECDDGNTQNGDGCSSVCTNETTQSANLGWNSTNYSNDGGTVIIPAGQTTTDKTIYWKIEGYTNCSIQKKTGWSYPGTWSQVTSGISGTGSLLLTNLATTTQSRPHRYRIGCSTNSSFQIMDGHETAGEGPVQFYVENAPLSSMNIGWTNSYSPKSKTVTVATGGTTNESLYVTTGGRTGCSLTGYMSSSNQVGVSPVSTTVGFAYNVSAPQSPTQYTYTLSCAGQTPVSATLTVNSSAPVCGNGVTEPGEQCDDGNIISGDSCSSTCQSENDDDTGAKLNSTCDGVIIPSRILVGKPFTVIPTFKNSGTVSWTTGFSAVSSGSLTSQTSYVQSSINPFGTFSPSYQFIAPTSSGPFALQFRMRDASNVPFEEACNVNGSFVLPECRDGVDNDDDGIIDFENSDPGCSSDNDDDETDPASGATLKISANPQLVRYGGSSNVSYEVGNCTVLDAESKPVQGTWTLVRDGAQIGAGISGIETTNGTRTHSVTGIQSKTTFTLSCGGTTRSATISVIKINEI